MKKKNEKSTGLTIGAVAVGVVDLILVVLLVLGTLIKTDQGESLTPKLNQEFTENAEDYGQSQLGGQYTAQETVQYTSAAGIQDAGQDSNTSAEEENALDTDAQTEGDLYEGFVFPDSNVELLTDSRIRETVTNASLCRRAINEIYARHGYAFTKKENTDFFNQYSWYKNMTKESDMSKVASRFSAVEKANVENLQAYENSQGWS